MGEPSATDANGRNPNGTLGKGNRAAVGNPHARRVAKLWAVLLDAVSEADLRAIAVKLVELAKGGDLAAIRELLNRTVGNPSAHSTRTAWTWKRCSSSVRLNASTTTTNGRGCSATDGRSASARVGPSHAPTPRGFRDGAEWQNML